MEKIADFIKMEGMEAEDPRLLYVAGCSSDYCGASVILYDGFLKFIAERLGKNFYILPSSIHECIVVPKESKIEKEMLLDMVVEVNCFEVSRQDKLTDGVYYYDAKADEFHLVETNANER